MNSHMNIPHINTSITSKGRKHNSLFINFGAGAESEKNLWQAPKK